MDNFIQQILNELYDLDPSMKTYEQDLVKALKKLIAARPAAQLSEQFRQELKIELMQAFGEHLPVRKTNNAFNFIFMKQFKFAGAVFTGLILIVAGVVYYQQTRVMPFSTEALFSQNVKITQLRAGAFGTLALGGENGFATEEATGLGGGGGAGAVAPRAQSGGGGNLAISKDTASAIYPVYSYEYQYVGDDISLGDTDRLPVFRKVIGQFTAQVVSALTNFNVGLIKLDSFQNKQLQNFAVVEDRSYGYIVSVDVVNEQVGLYENYQTWDDPYANCVTEDCYERLRLKESDMPSDEQLIAISDAFLQKHGVDMDAYGTPQVNNDWRLYQDSVNGNIFVPDVVSIIYPLVLNGETVYDEGGRPTGLNVNVNVRQQIVSGVWNLSTQNYESSEYQVETDADRLITLAKQGNWRYPLYHYEGENVNKITVELGTPDHILVQVYMYTNGTSEQLFVPALSFPVVNVSGNQGNEDKYLVNSRVVIPIVKDLLDQAEADNLLMPRPLMESAVSSVEVGEKVVPDTAFEE